MTRLPKGADQDVWALATEAVDEGKPAPFFVELAGRSKSAFKAVSAAINGPRGATVRSALVELVGANDDHKDDTRWLLRRASSKEAAARTRKNPIVRNEAFDCGHCGFSVPPLSRGERNHCPRCLRSAHVDGLAPGDRSSGCGGLMIAEHLEVLGGTPRVTHRCLRCGFTRRNRLFPDREPEPDRIELLLPSGPGGPSGE